MSSKFLKVMKGWNWDLRSGLSCPCFLPTSVNSHHGVVWDIDLSDRKSHTMLGTGKDSQFSFPRRLSGISCGSGISATLWS